MRRLALGLALLLAACQMSAPEGGDVTPLEDEVIAVTTLAEGDPEGAPPTAPAALPATLAPPTGARALPTEPGGADETVALPTEEVPEVPVISAAQRACEAGGGQWAGAALKVCVKTLRDGGKQCRRASDCLGECLAPSGTCAPITPLMGCNDILDDQGRRMTQCLQ